MSRNFSSELRLIKRPGEQSEYSKELLDELEKCAKDPIYFIETYCKIQHATRGEVPFIMYPFQKRMVYAYLKNRWNIVLSSRQVGKTVTSACYLLWYAIFRFDSNILITSRRNSDAMDIIGKVRYSYEGLPDWLRPGVREYSKHTAAFDNGSQIRAEATTENTGRGQAITVLYLDEFAFVPPGLAIEFWTSITPTLSTGGDCIITSTPNGDEDTFSSIWTGAISQTNGFFATQVNWDEHPDRDEDFKRKMIAKIGELRWRQEYGNEFLSSNESLISGLRLAVLKHSRPIDEKNGFYFWEEIREGGTYVLGCDVGTGTGGDYSTIQCFSFPDLKQVAEFRDNQISTPIFAGKLVWLLKLLAREGAESFFSVENNGVGEGVIASISQMEDMMEEDIPGTFIHDFGKNVRGMNTTKKKKLAVCMELKNLLDNSHPRIHIRSKRLITELKFFVRKGPSFEARIGATDDLVAGLLIMLRVTKEAAQWDLDAFEKLYSLDGNMEDDLMGNDSDEAMPIISSRTEIKTTGDDWGQAEGEEIYYRSLDDY